MRRKGGNEGRRRRTNRQALQQNQLKNKKMAKNNETDKSHNLVLKLTFFRFGDLLRRFKHVRENKTICNRSRPPQVSHDSRTGFGLKDGTGARQ